MGDAEKVYSGIHAEFQTKAFSEVYFRNSRVRFLSDKKDAVEKKRREQETETALNVSLKDFGDHTETAATLLFAGVIAKRCKE